MSTQNVNTSDALAPKPGLRTSSFVVWVATLIVGGVFTYLIRRGMIDENGAAIHRHVVVEVVAEALPIAWFAVVGWLGKVFIKMRGQVSVAKVEAASQVETKGRQV